MFLADDFGYTLAVHYSLLKRTTKFCQKKEPDIHTFNKFKIALFHSFRWGIHCAVRNIDVLALSILVPG